MAMGEAHPEEDRSREPEKILIPVANPNTIEYLMNLSLVIRDPKQKDNLLALNVINSSTTTRAPKPSSSRASATWSVRPKSPPRQVWS